LLESIAEEREKYNSKTSLSISDEDEYLSSEEE
jgi:hypothetical protein